MSYLSMKDINKMYPGNVQAVFDFSLDVEEGEFIILVGPSGCGKSTVLRMIAGLEEISSGDMFLQEKRINDLAPSDRQVAMVFQDYALYGNMTVYENIGFSLTIRGDPSDVIHDRVMGISKTVELYDYLNRFPKALSGGQRQRVAMGRSLAKYAKILLMDEPLSNLDAQLRQQTRGELALLHNSLHPTIVYVTHDQTEAMTLATRIVVMNEGRVQQVGTPHDIYHYPENIFTASFIGMPPINLVKGFMEEGMFTVTDANKEKVFQCKAPLPFPERNIILGLRPEIIRVVPAGTNTKEDECKLEVTVCTLEFHGAEYYAGFKMGERLLTFRTPANIEIKLGQKLDIAFNIHKAHFFDEVSGLRLKGQS